MNVARSVPSRLRHLDASQVIVIIASLLGVLSLVFSGLRLADYSASREQARNSAELAIVQSTRSSAAAVDELLNSIAATVDDLASRLNDGSIDDRLTEQLSFASEGTPLEVTSCGSSELDPSTLEPALCVAAGGIAEINGIGVVFDRAHDSANSYRPYANRIDGTLVLGELASRDFEATNWFANAAQSGGLWTHPQFGKTSQKLLAYYSAPFFAADGSVRGVLVATYALDRLADDLRWLSVGATGYSIVLSDAGRLVSHPTLSSVQADFEGDGSGATTSGTVDTFRNTLAADPDGSGLVADVVDDVTGAAAWLVYEPIPSVGWTFGAVAVEDDVHKRTAAETRLLIDTVLGLFAAALLVGVGALRLHSGSNRSLWALSSTSAVLALAVIGWIWYLTIASPGDIASNPSDVAWPSSHAASADQPEPLFAGVFVQSVEFTGSNDVTASGIVWQEQRSDSAQSEPPGFIFPEADEVSFEEAYRSTTGNLTRIGWSFTASLRQTFDYARYPLDRETVWLRLWPADYEVSWLMLPALASYQTLAPSTGPGIEQDFVVEGWTLEASSFSYRVNDYNTNFGLRDHTSNPTPELYFNVHLKRSFLDALMSQLVPLTVVTVLLFSVLLITTRKQANGEALDFSALGVLGYCAALFFVVILSHTDLRSELKAQQVIYLEYFYFAAYLAILMVSANAILVGMGRGGRLIHGRNNLIPSLLFWPVLNGSLLAVTLIAFY